MLKDMWHAGIVRWGSWDGDAEAILAVGTSDMKDSCTRGNMAELNCLSIHGRDGGNGNGFKSLVHDEKIIATQREGGVSREGGTK